MSRRGRMLVGGTAAAALAFLGACDGDNGGETVETTTSSAGTSTSSGPPVTTAGPTTAGPTTSSVPSAPDQVIAVVVRGGAVEGGFRRVTVVRGDTVVVRVSSDTADEVYIPGYERRADLAAGGTAEVSFVANMPGNFTVELVEDRLRLVELEVS